MEESKNADGVTDLLNALANVWNHALGFMKSMSLKCALELGIPDTIHKHGKPMTISELAAALSIPPSKVDRLQSLMRLLSHSGFFVIQNEEPTFHKKEEGYILTPSSRLLVEEEKASIKPFVVMSLHSIMVDLFQNMAPWFKETGTTLFKMAHGKQFWEATNARPDFNELFNNGMASDARFVAEVMSRGLSDLFCGVGSLVDVGGGTGTLAIAIAEKYCDIKCTVFDLPHVIDTVPKNTLVDFIGGDMFQEIPHADVVLLKCILHDWSDEESIKILQRCKEAIPSPGKVIVIDMVVGNTIGTHTFIETQLLLDLKMTGLTMGKERDESEWRSIFLAAGFGRIGFLLGEAGSRTTWEVTDRNLTVALLGRPCSSSSSFLLDLIMTKGPKSNTNYVIHEKAEVTVIINGVKVKKTRRTSQGSPPTIVALFTKGHKVAACTLIVLITVYAILL